MTYHKTEWAVEFTRNAAKQVKKLDLAVCSALQLLVEDLKNLGPAPGKGWPNYSKLYGPKNRDRRHCHLLKGHPTYVCCWEVINKNIQIVEIYYVGTHEKAPY